MSAVITIILVIWGAYYFARWFFSKALPKLLVWFVHRQARKQYEQMFGQSQAQSSQQQRTRSRSQGWSPFSRQSRQQQPRRRRGKIITKDMGEYVEFEEIPTYTPPSSHQQPTGKHYADEPQISDAEWEDL